MKTIGPIQMVQYRKNVLRQWQAEELVEMSIDLSGMIYQELTQPRPWRI